VSVAKLQLSVPSTSYNCHCQVVKMRTVSDVAHLLLSDILH